ncbi:Clavaminate synthase-like protein [Pseudohyphozyma bogoriensis]|nr:Clavaminate synthase-like protein [Pseudohyphozyma bogoriensis]
MTSSNPIPLIDLQGASAQDLAAQVGHAVQTVGFLHVKGLGVTSEQVDRMFMIHKELFESPLAELQACPTDGKNGYGGLGGNRLDEKSKDLPGDIKCNFVYGRYFPPNTETVQPLPPVMQRYKAEVDAFHAACYEGTCQLLDAFSLAMNLPVHFFRDAHRQGGCGLALNNYPAVPASRVPTGEGVARASAHKDWGSVTLLFQEQSGTPGLEIFHEGQWWPAPIIPDTVLVNVGLALELWSSNVLKATLHRVITHTEPEGGFKARKSIAYFVQPKDEVVFNKISPDGTIATDDNAMTSREFFDARMSATVVKAN